MRISKNNRDILWISLILCLTNSFFVSSISHAQSSHSFLPPIYLLLNSKKTLEVESTYPSGGTTNIYIDTEIDLTFSDNIHQGSPLSAFSITDSNGITAKGKWMVQNDRAVFAPVRFNPLETYTVTVSTAVRGEGGERLAAQYTSQFTTGETTSSGVYPPTLQNAPLGAGRFTTVAKRPEYAIVWTTEKSSMAPNVYTESNHQIFALEDPSDDPSTGTADSIVYYNHILTADAEKWPVAGQFDDDPWDEVMVVQLLDGNVSLMLSDTEEANWVVLEPIFSSLAGVSNIETLDAVAADFDQDGRDEIFIFMQKSGSVQYVTIDYNPDSTNYEVVAQGSFDNFYTSVMKKQEVQVAAGDIDADNIPEAVVMWYGAYLPGVSSKVFLRIFDDLSTNMSVLNEERTLLNVNYDVDSRCPYPTVSLTTADADSDGVDEIFVGVSKFTWMAANGWWPTQHQCRNEDVLYYMDNITTDDPTPPALQGGNAEETVIRGNPWFWVNNSSADRTLRNSMSMIAAGRFTGDPVREEVLFSTRIYRFDKQDRVDNDAMAHTPGWPIDVPTSVFQEEIVPATGYETADLSRDFLTRDVAVGDIDGDMKEDVVLLRKSSQASNLAGIYDSGFKIVYFDLDVDGGNTAFDIHTEELKGEADYLPLAGSPRLALANVDDDSPMLELTHHEPIITDNILVAVLAAPPYKNGIGQDTGACTTEFGEGTGTNYTFGVFGALTVGATLGFEFQPSLNLSLGLGIKINMAKLEIQGSAGVKTGFEVMMGKSISEEYSYETGSLNNLVIVDNYIYDSFTYTVIAHPDADRIGDFVTVNVPTGKRRMIANQSYYNSINGDGMDIDDSILPSTPGDFASYPSRAEAEDILNVEENSPIIEISAGTFLLQPSTAYSGATHYAYEITTTDGASGTVSLYRTASITACGPDVAGWTPQTCVGLESEVEIGVSISQEFSDTLSFKTSLGPIPPENSMDVYSTGMYAYRKTIDPDPNAALPNNREGDTPGAQQFIVVGYFID